MALAAHAGVAALIFATPPRALPKADEPPAIALVEVYAAAPGLPVAADLQEAPMVEAVAWPDPPTAPPPPPTPRPRVRATAPSGATAPPAPSGATAPAPPSVPAAPAAPAQAAAPPDPQIVAAWQAALSAWIERNRRYPPAARFRQEEGVVQVRFELDPTGKVLRAEIQQDSGSATLNAAALTLLNGATLPAPPRDLDPARRIVSLAIRYRLE